MRRTSPSLRKSFGVVPLETSAWNPDTAPHAIVINTNGKSLPANIGPVPSTNLVKAGSLSSGCVSTMEQASSATVPNFRNVDR